MTLEEKKYRETILNMAHRAYGKDLARYSFCKIHNQALSEDLVQDTFLRAWMYLMRGGKIVVMKSFLYRILNNLIVDEYRKHKTVSLDDMIDDGFDPESEEGDFPTSTLDGEKAMEVMNTLPEKYRQIMYMRYVGGLSLKEISELTGQAKNNVAVQVHRSLKKMKSLYEFKGPMLSGGAAA